MDKKPEVVVPSSPTKNTVVDPNVPIPKREVTKDGKLKDIPKEDRG